MHPADEAAKRARAAGIPLVHMVTTAEQAAAAAGVGVSVIAAQGTEAGGGLVGSVGGMVLVPAVVDAVSAATRGASGPPVVAAGGVADGRGLAAALILGAEGVLAGTRFLATAEASVPFVWEAAICAASEADTIHTRIGNLVARPTWANVAPGRVLRTEAIEMWVGREAELAALSQAERAAIAGRWTQARAEGRTQETEIIAGQDCGLIRDVIPAAAVVRRIVAEGDQILRTTGSRYAALGNA